MESKMLFFQKGRTFYSMAKFWAILAGKFEKSWQHWYLCGAHTHTHILGELRDREQLSHNIVWWVGEAFRGDDEIICP
jgi:hypothetical protein